MAGKALDGVRILDFTHVQSGPTCTQLLAYLGADCIKVERPGVGDITRTQLRDVKGQNSLYFTMLNGNKRSITIDSKNPKGKEILERLVKICDVLVENFAPGALDRMGLHLGTRAQAQPAHDHGVGQGLRTGTLRRVQGVRERRAMRRRFGVDDRLSRRPAARHRRADRRFRHRAASRLRHLRGAVSAHAHRPRTADHVRDAGRRAQSRAREAARSAAPEAWAAHGIQPVRRRHPVRPGGAARGQRFRRRSAGLDLEVQRRAAGSRRVYLFHYAGAGVGTDLRSDREDRNGRPIPTTRRRRRVCRG